MPAINKPAPFAGSCTSIIHRAFGGIVGLREISDDLPRLSVYTFPFAMIEQAASAKSLLVPACYILSDGRTIYIGESGNVGRRLLEHAADPAKDFADEVFIVSAFDDQQFDKTAAIYFQHRLTGAAEALGVVRVMKGTSPQAIVLPHSRVTALNRAIDDAQRLLFDAGCRAFHSNGPGRAAVPPPSAPSRSSPLLSLVADEEDERDDGLMEIGVSTTPIDVEEFELIYGNVWARGYQHGENFVVAAGSEIRRTINDSVNPIIRTRRKELEDTGVLMPIPGVEDRRRLTVAVAFPSISIAAKVVCGAHVNRSKWQPLRQMRPIMLAV
jgi:hypothetical protein